VRTDDGYSLPKLTIDSWKEVTRLREQIDRLAIGPLLEVPEQRAQVHYRANTALHAMIEAQRSHNLLAFVEADVAFHASFVCRNDALALGLKSILGVLYFAGIHEQPGEVMSQAIDDHARMVDLLSLDQTRLQGWLFEELRGNHQLHACLSKHYDKTTRRLEGFLVTS